MNQKIKAEHFKHRMKKFFGSFQKLNENAQD